jgi:hyperosmotically inducible protein
MRALTLLGLTAALLLGQSASVSAQLSEQDRRLGERIVDSILTYGKYSVFDHIEIRIDNRNVVLEGRVTIPLKKDEIEKRVAKIDGIRSLTNDIGVLPVSQMDQRLRVAVANAIFGHPSFWRYAEQAVPPIHIIVEHQRITLVGVVDSQVDRMLAYSLAQVGSNLGVENKLRIGR